MQGSAPIIQALGQGDDVYPIEKLEAHLRGLRHLAVSAFVFADGHLLLQKRALGKYHSGGQWANTCCSHPAWGESPAACVRRRVREELGFECVFKAAGRVDYAADVGDGLIENEVVHLFTAEVDRHTVRLDLDPREVTEVRWMPVTALQEDAHLNPHLYTPWLRIYLERASPLVDRAA